MISWFEGSWSDMLSLQYSRWERSIGTDIARINKLRDTLRWGSIRCAVPRRRTVEKINILDWSEVPPLFWTPPRIHLNNSGQLSKCPLVLVKALYHSHPFPRPTNISVCCLKNCTKLVKTFLYKAPFTFSASLHRSNIRYILPLCLSLLTDVFSPVVCVFKNSHWFLASSMGVGSLAVQLMDNTTATFVIMNPLWQAT